MYYWGSPNMDPPGDSLGFLGKENRGTIKNKLHARNGRLADECGEGFPIEVLPQL